MRVHHINCGTMCPVSARLVNGRGGLFETARMVCHCLLVEGKDGLVLVDTGLGTGDIATPRARLGAPFLFVTRPTFDPSETALAHVERLGFSARDVRHIVPTHLDLDHAGGLSDFPDATVHLFEREQSAALAPPSRAERHRYRPAHFAHGPKWRAYAHGGDAWFGFEGVRTLEGADVVLVPLHGHTRGHAGIAVRGDGGWLLHAGDAYFHHRELAREPVCPPALRMFQRLVAVDNEARLANQARLRELALTHGGEVTVLSAHCPVELARDQSVPVPAPAKTNGRAVLVS